MSREMHRSGEKLPSGGSRFSLLQEISHSLVATDNVGAIADIMLDLSMSYTDAEQGSLMLVDESGKLYVFAARGFDAEGLLKQREKIGKGVAGTVAKNRIPLLVRDIGRDDRFRKIRRDRYRTNSFISCPIIARSRLFGVVNLNDKKNGEPFSRDELTLLTIITNQAAITFENAYLMRQVQTQAAELAEITRRLNESDAAKHEFINRISHELRTPLNSINGSIYYLGLNGKIGRRRQKEFFDIIAHGANEIRTSVEHLLTFLRREERPQMPADGVRNSPADS